MGETVQRVTTPLTRYALGHFLVLGHRSYFGGPPSLARLSVAWSHCALEHAHGDLLYNYNFGNVTAGNKWEGDSYVMHVPPPDPPVLRFRAFPEPELGAKDYWNMLDKHYAPALALFDWGRAYDACILLGQLGYYTANRKTYSTAVANYKAWFDKTLASSFVAELAEGQGNSLLSQHEIDEVLASNEPHDGRRIDDQVLDELRDRDTNPGVALDDDELKPPNT